MPYVLNAKSSGERGMKLRFNGTLSSSVQAYKNLDLVYSHRTGSAAEGAKLSSEEQYIPPKTNILDALNYRRRFIERQIGTMLTDNPLSSRPKNYILGDLGHEFAVKHMKLAAGPCSFKANPFFTGEYEFINPIPRHWLYVADDDRVPRISVDPFGDPAGFFKSRAGFALFNWSNNLGRTETQMNQGGTDALNAISPFKATGGIFATLFELVRGDVPGVLVSLRKHMNTILQMKASGIKDAAQALGSEYLNNVFGWTPIIKDIQAAITVLTGIDSLLFPEDSTRRSYKTVIRSDAHSLSGYPSMGMFPAFWPGRTWDAMTINPRIEPVNPTPYGIGVMPATFGLSYTDSLWTTARFATGARPSGTNNAHLDRVIDLLGLEITPALVWELTPWSWLIDWFFNIGTVIENMSNLGLSNTILNYAYVTYRREEVATVGVDPRWMVSNYPGSSFKGDGWNFSMTSDSKVRIAASPFGFGIAGDSLSSSQLAILTALGLARLR